METLSGIFGTLDTITWGWALIPILVVVGLYFTLMTGLVQFQFFGRMFRQASPAHNEARSGGISGWQALMVSVGGRVGGGKPAYFFSGFFLLPFAHNIDKIVVQKCALRIQTHHLTASAKTRINGEYALLPQRRSQKKLA